jgi:hypothetical protein
MDPDDANALVRGLVFCIGAMCGVLHHGKWPRAKNLAFVIGTVCAVWAWHLIRSGALDY